MKKYDLKGIENYFTSEYDLGFSDFVLDNLLHRMKCYEENFEKDIYENCDSREEAEKWARRYVILDCGVCDKFTLILSIKEYLDNELSSVASLYFDTILKD